MRSPFVQSPEFLKLLQRDPAADLTRIAFEIARDEYPDLDAESYLQKIEALADRVRDRCPTGAGPRQVLGQINWVLYVEEGYQGNTEDYGDPRNSYLNEVIDRRLGIPISLSVLYRALAVRLGLDASGVNLPAHFMLRVGHGGSTIFIDPFHAGALLDRAGCERSISNVIGQSIALSDRQLAPCSVTQVVSRMLRNLKAIYLQRNDFMVALPVQRRLAALDPGILRSRETWACSACRSIGRGTPSSRWGPISRPAPTPTTPTRSAPSSAPPGAKSRGGIEVDPSRRPPFRILREESSRRAGDLSKRRVRRPPDLASAPRFPRDSRTRACPGRGVESTFTPRALILEWARPRRTGPAQEEEFADMRTWTLSSRLLFLPLCLAGCASTSATRSGGAPRIRTVASIGDKTLPIVSGTPGSTVMAEKVIPELRVGTNGRVSGRVVDSEGRPVPNAQVRLAVGGARGGRMHRATTDQSGAFTLRGLRPRASYTVIAELNDQRGQRTGRSDVRAPDTDVRITLSSPEVDPGMEAPGSSTRVSSISDRSELESAEDGAEPALVNEEDLLPGPDDPLPPASRLSRRQAEMTDSPSTRGATWRREDPSVVASHSSTSMTDTSPAPVDTEMHGTASASEALPYDDDGVNPLPPALEREAPPEPPAGDEPKAGPPLEEEPAPPIRDEQASCSASETARPREATLRRVPPRARPGSTRGRARGGRALPCTAIDPGTDEAGLTLPATIDLAGSRVAVAGTRGTRRLGSARSRAGCDPFREEGRCTPPFESSHAQGSHRRRKRRN